jgi:hypothetical protein
MSGLYSPKTGKTYRAVVVLEDTGKYVNYKLDLKKEAENERTQRNHSAGIPPAPIPLKNAEMALEGNYNQIDGLINNEKPRYDLTNGQSYEDLRELAPKPCGGKAVGAGAAGPGQSPGGSPAEPRIRSAAER